MPRPMKALISKGALSHNLQVLKAKAGERFFWAVVKANAYGHGLIPLLDVFDKYSDGLALLLPSDAEECRRAGWTKPIILIEGIFSPEDLEVADVENLEVVVHSRTQIDWITRQNRKNTLAVHIKCNSGMNRLGFRPGEIPTIFDTLSRLPKVKVVDIVSHFANAEITYDLEKPVSVPKQLSELQALRKLCPMCLSNTGALLWHPAAEDHAVRPGIAIYGVSPDMSITESKLDLIPVMTLQSAIIGIQNMKVGEHCGYGSKFRAERPTRLAVVACGYADGYPRKQGKWREVFIEGKRAPLIGNVSMDMLAIDVTDIPQASVGSTVEFWGRNISVNDVAASFGTIGHELICGVTARVPRIYVE